MRINEQGPGFSNALANSSSPYLRQHAKNPVYWYPWGKEAIERAKLEDKPILVSVGYSTCYWCHVMEREVFENLSIASLMNRSFINIKIDREEHPALDEFFMTIRQFMTHEGGWPNHVVLTPDLKPYFAGGTFGPADDAHRPGFPRLIEWLNSMWIEERQKLEDIGANNLAMTQQFLVAQQETPVTDISPLVADVRRELEKKHDVTSGGFFAAPKFPQENYLQFLLSHYDVTGDEQSLHMAAFSLGKMAAGGLQDHVGAGFHRYAVDKEWLVPHFEKMLYTQAMLARCYTEAARLTGNDYFRDMACSICDFMSGPMMDASGAFYAAIDAETDGVEGDYYAWSSQELEKIFDEDEKAFFIHHYGLADIPHFPGHKKPSGDVIFARMPLYEAALAQKLPYVQIAAMAGELMNKLLKVRNLRQSPHLDNKIIMGWNGLMIDALAQAGITFGQKHYIAQAQKAAEYLLQYGVDGQGHLVRCITHGKAEQQATLEDYAFFIKGLLSLFEATRLLQHLETAKKLLDDARDLFGDGTAFFNTRAGGLLPVRSKNGDDSTLPSANAIMAENYYRMSLLTGDPAYANQARDIVRFFLAGEKRLWLEYITMLRVAMQMEGVSKDAKPLKRQLPEDLVHVEMSLFPKDPRIGEEMELRVMLDIAKGWHIQPGEAYHPPFAATRVFVRGDGFSVENSHFPEPTLHMLAGEQVPVHEGRMEILILLKAQSTLIQNLEVMIEFQPCSDDRCLAPVKRIVVL